MVFIFFRISIKLLKQRWFSQHRTLLRLLQWILISKYWFFYHSKYTVAYSKPSYRDITSFSFNFANFPPLSSQSSTVNCFNSLQSSKLSSNPNFLTQKSFVESVLNSNHSRFLFWTTATQNSGFSPSAHKPSVASAPVKNVSSFSSNSTNSL